MGLTRNSLQLIDKQTKQDNRNTTLNIHRLTRTFSTALCPCITFSNWKKQTIHGPDSQAWPFFVYDPVYLQYSYQGILTRPRLLRQGISRGCGECELFFE